MYIRLVLPPPPPPPEMHPAAEPNILCELRSADWKLDSQPTTRSKNGHKEERVLSQWARRAGEGGREHVPNLCAAPDLPTRQFRPERGGVG